MNKIYLHFLKNYIFTQKKHFVLVCLVTVVQSVVTMCIPLTCQELLDNAFPNRDMTRFIEMVIAMVFCYVVCSILNVVKDYLLARIAERISFQLRTALNNKISVMNYSYFDTHNLGEMLSKYNKEVDMVKENCGYMLVRTISNVVVFLLASLMILMMDWRVMIVSICLLSLYIVNNKYWGKRVKKLAEKSMECNETAINALTENYRNVLITKLYSAYEYVNNKFCQYYEKQYHTQIKLEFFYSVNINSGGLLTYFLAGLIWLIGGFGILAGNLTVGTVTALINYQGMLLSPMAFFSEFNNSYQSTVIALKRLFGVLNCEEECMDGIELNTDSIEKICFKNVSFGYSKEISVLKDINIELKRGEITTFVGGSGCGKSSLVKMLLRLYIPQEGSIWIDGQKIQDIAIEKLRKKIAFVAQDSLFFKGSLLENLRLGKNIDDSKLIEYSKLLDLYDEIICLPKKWNTELNGGASTLSGGQKKRLDVLRALLKEADVLIFDESTAPIDIERRKKLFEILNTIKQNKIIIFITHNIEECSYSDNIYAIKNKKVYPINCENLREAYC